MSQVTTLQLTAQYEKEGFVIVPNVLDLDLIEEAQAQLSFQDLDDLLRSGRMGRKSSHSKRSTSWLFDLTQT